MLKQLSHCTNETRMCLVEHIPWPTAKQS